MSDNPDALKALKEKLDTLESRIREILVNTNEDLKLAKKIQGLLMPNRLPKFPGLESYAKYISARELSSEFYDLIPTDNHRHLWIVQSWTSNFGLGSLITQSFMTLQGRKLLAHSDQKSVRDVYTELLSTFMELHEGQKGTLRLMLRRLDMNRLKLESVGFGFPPPLLRLQERNLWGPFQIEALEYHAQLQSPLAPKSYAELTAESVPPAEYSLQIRPGSRIFFMGASWNPTANLQEFFRPINSQTAEQDDNSGSPEATSHSELLDDLNFLVLESQQFAKTNQIKSDICIEAFEVDRKLLHLA